MTYAAVCLDVTIELIFAFAVWSIALSAWAQPTFLHWEQQYGPGFSPCNKRVAALLCLFYSTQGRLCLARPWFPWWHGANPQWTGEHLQAVPFSFLMAVDCSYVPILAERAPTALARLSSLRLHRVHWAPSYLLGCVCSQHAQCQKNSDSFASLYLEHHWT